MEKNYQARHPRTSEEPKLFSTGAYHFRLLYMKKVKFILVVEIFSQKNLGGDYNFIFIQLVQFWTMMKTFQ